MQKNNLVQSNEGAEDVKKLDEIQNTKSGYVENTVHVNSNLDKGENPALTIDGATQFHVSEPPTAMSGCINSQGASPSLSTPAAIIEPSSIYIPISMSEHETISTGINTDKSRGENVPSTSEGKNTPMRERDSTESNINTSSATASATSSAITGYEYERGVEDDVPPLGDIPTPIED